MAAVPSALQKDTTYTKIFVGGLPYHTTDNTLKDYFKQFGDIDEAVVITDRQTGKSRGYGFVTMSDRIGADRACKEPNPIIDGRKANVNLAYLGAKPRVNAGFASAVAYRTGIVAAGSQFGGSFQDSVNGYLNPQLQTVQLSAPNGFASRAFYPNGLYPLVNGLVPVAENEVTTSSLFRHPCVPPSSTALDSTNHPHEDIIDASMSSEVPSPQGFLLPPASSPSGFNSPSTIGVMQVVQAAGHPSTMVPAHRIDSVRKRYGSPGVMMIPIAHAPAAGGLQHPPPVKIARPEHLAIAGGHPSSIPGLVPTSVYPTAYSHLLHPSAVRRVNSIAPYGMTVPDAGGYRATTPLIAGYPTYLTSPQGVLATALPPSATAGGSAAAQFAAIDYSAIPGQFAAGTAAAYDASVYATYGNAGAASQYALPYAGYALPQHLVGAGGTYAAYQQPIGERLQ